MGEALAALVALVGLFARVQSRVLNEMVLVFEGLLADLALMWTLACRDTGTGGRERRCYYGDLQFSSTETKYRQLAVIYSKNVQLLELFIQLSIYVNSALI